MRGTTAYRRRGGRPNTPPLGNPDYGAEVEPLGVKTNTSFPRDTTGVKTPTLPAPPPEPDIRYPVMPHNPRTLRPVPQIPHRVSHLWVRQSPHLVVELG